MVQVVTQKIPYQEKFNLCKKCARWGEGLLLAAGVLSLLLILPIIAYIPGWLVKSLTAINILLLLGQFTLYTISEVYLYPETETERVKGLFDDAFKTNLLDRPLAGYYSNEELPYGVQKMLVDYFEGSFFTYNIARKMNYRLIVKNATFFMLFVIVAILGLPTIGWLSMIQIFASQPFLLLLIRHLYFTRCVRNAYENFKRSFEGKNDIDALFAAITYEKALSGYASMIDSSIYNQLKDRLSAEWTTMKDRYHITQNQPTV